MRAALRRPDDVYEIFVPVPLIESGPESRRVFPSNGRYATKVASRNISESLLARSK